MGSTLYGVGPLGVGPLRVSPLGVDALGVGPLRVGALGVDALGVGPLRIGALGVGPLGVGVGPWGAGRRGKGRGGAMFLHAAGPPLPETKSRHGQAHTAREVLCRPRAITRTRAAERRTGGALRRGRYEPRVAGCEPPRCHASTVFPDERAGGGGGLHKLDN